MRDWEGRHSQRKHPYLNRHERIEEPSIGTYAGLTWDPRDDEDIHDGDLIVQIEFYLKEGVPVFHIAASEHITEAGEDFASGAISRMVHEFTLRVGTEIGLGGIIPKGTKKTTYE